MEKIPGQLDRKDTALEVKSLSAKSSVKIVKTCQPLDHLLIAIFFESRIVAHHADTALALPAKLSPTQSLTPSQPRP